MPIIIGALGTVSKDNHRKVVSRDKFYLSLRIIAESVQTGYSQNPSQGLGHLRSRAVT